MGLVWQALARVKSAALQVVRHLDCRQGLPVDSLEPPSSYARVSGTGVDAAADVHVAVHAMADGVADVVIEPVADAGADPVTPPASSERAAEELPHDAPPSPPATSPLKSVLRRPEGMVRKEGATLSFDTSLNERKITTKRSNPKKGVQPSLSMVESWRKRPLPSLFPDRRLLNFKMATQSSGRASVDAFEADVQPHVFMLNTTVDYWMDDTLTTTRRLTVLNEARSELQGLTSLTQNFSESVRSGQASEIDGSDARCLLETLEDKLLDLGFAQARLQGLIEEQESLQRAEAENARLASLGPSSDEESTEESSDDNNAYQGLDFSGIDDFKQGSAAFAVKGMRGAISRLLDEISDLKDEAGERGQTLAGQILAVEGIVEKLAQLHRVLAVNVNEYIGRNNEFQEWMSEKMDSVQLEFQEWERALNRLSAQQAAGPQPG